MNPNRVTELEQRQQVRGATVKDMYRDLMVSFALLLHALRLFDAVYGVTVPFPYSYIIYLLT